ncbi:MAG: DUF3987 domain-containing protein [Gemmatimonadaceae bacterium]
MKTHTTPGIAPSGEAASSAQEAAMRLAADEAIDAAPIVLTPTLNPAALHGVLGDYVRAVAPHTEAHPAGVLASLLVTTGSLIGRAPHQRFGNTRHGGNLFTLIVGPSADGRKGTAVDAARELLARTDEDFNRRNVVNGMASGQGLLYKIRDAAEAVHSSGPPTAEPDAKHSNVARRERDPGVSDKRLLAIESEAGQQFKLMAGRENTLSATLRTLFDAPDSVHSLTKGEPITATEPHVSVIAQITPEELESAAGAVEYSNGLLNRFMLVYVRRTKSLPFATGLPPDELDRFARRLRAGVDHARRAAEVRLAPEARGYWAAAYEELSAGAAGRVGQLTRRGPAIVRRVAMLYALLDGASSIEVQHLTAALALWQYSRDSVRYVFRSSPGLSPLASKLLAAMIAAAPSGCDKTALRESTGSHNRAASDISRALEELRTAGLADVETVGGTGGRPRQVWTTGRVPITYSAGSMGEMGDMGDNPSPGTVTEEVNAHKAHNAHTALAPTLNDRPFGCSTCSRRFYNDSAGDPCTFCRKASDSAGAPPTAPDRIAVRTESGTGADAAAVKVTSGGWFYQNYGEDDTADEAA